MQHSRNYDFHSHDYDLRLAVKTRCSRDNGHDYDTLFSALVLRSREYIMGSWVHIFSKDYTICIKDKLGSIAILSLEGDLRAEGS